MRFLKNIFMGLIIFIFGAEVGGFTMWYLAMTAIYEDRDNRRKKYVSYR